jgi:archaellum component FlaC
MTWFSKKADPINDRARALNEEIAALEEQIKRLDSQLQQNQSPHPRLRAPALPHSGPARLPEPTTHTASSALTREPAREPSREPIFEEVDLDRLKTRGELETTPEHYNDLGVRKYDLPALFRRVRNHFRGPSTTNPKLVSYLAAGGIQGLRPIRYEKRVARNRFILLVAFLFFVVFGIFVVIIKQR